jgi:hypothetical protein
MMTSTVEVSRPPVTMLKKSATKRTIHRSPKSMSAVTAAGESSWSSTGDSKTPKPVAVNRRPTALSGRWRHASRPHAMNETPASLLITTYPGSGGPRSKITGIRATNPAATAATDASQKPRPCVGAVNRVSAWTRLRVTGRATSSRSPRRGTSARTPIPHGIERIIRVSRL